MIELLKKRHGKRRVVLLGHRWGSIVGQVVDFRVSYDMVLEQVRRDNNAEAMKDVEAIRPYPGLGLFDLQKLGIECTWSIHYGGLAAYRPMPSSISTPGAFRPDIRPPTARPGTTAATLR